MLKKQAFLILIRIVTIFLSGTVNEKSLKNLGAAGAPTLALALNFFAGSSISDFATQRSLY